MPTRGREDKMAIDERARHDLLKKLEELLGEERALTLMTGLPREEPATKKDLDAVEGRLVLRMDGLEGRMDGLEGRVEAMEDRLIMRIDSSADRVLGELHQRIGEVYKELVNQTRVFVLSTVGAVVTVGGLAVAAARFG